MLCALLVSMFAACGGGAAVDEQPTADRAQTSAAPSASGNLEATFTVQTALSFQPQPGAFETPANAQAASANPGAAAPAGLAEGTPLRTAAESLPQPTVADAAMSNASGLTDDTLSVEVLVAAAAQANRNSVPAAPPWAPRVDPRVVTLLDADDAADKHHDRDLLQLADGQSIHWLKALPTNGLRHADGSLWFGREQLADGRSTFTARIWRNQPLFQGKSQRAEWHAPNGGIQNLPWVIDETKGYWFAVDYAFGADVVENTGTQYGGGAAMTISGLHAITWGDMPRSEGQDFGGRVVGRQLMWRIHSPGANPSFVYDVRKTPLSTQAVRSVDAGGDSGTSRHWIIADLQPKLSVKLVGRVKFADTLAGKPRTELWRKIGNGPVEKIIDNLEPNTFSKGVRYWKVGNYTWDTSPQWWGNKDSRTMHIRSDVWVRDESRASSPELSVDMLMRWLDR